ncbi:MAG: WYL domain-containing protein [Gammaproteobacteria bacterium]|nr:WYL domain-containing protein [Gammaproteobacteria bacterium]
MSEVLYRHWVMLQLVPRPPRKISAQTVHQRLEGLGYETTERTVQRDLIKLSRIFPLVSDDRDKPFGWSWAKDAPMFDLPSMDVNTALTFYLTEKFLKHLMPPTVSDHILPHYKRASEVLDKMPGKKLKHWRNKIRILSRTQHLLPPKIDEQVVSTVYQALLADQQFRVTYKPRSGEVQLYEVSPRGLVIRDQVIYLVATLWGYSDVKQLLLHRMSDIELLDYKVKKIALNLDEYISSGGFDLVEQEKQIRLIIRISNHTVQHLLETPLSNNQVVKPDGEHMSVLSAEVKDTQQLRWWLLGFGDGVEVIKPIGLRKEMIQVVDKMKNNYAT